ncbi:MAG: response regulator [Casimicrobiaceae bacterium]
MSGTGKYVVAVVDDDRRVLESLKDLLESAGYEARPFPSAANLLAHEGGLTDLDCLISDIGMPGMDGFELRRAAKAARADLPVILITGRNGLSQLPDSDSDCMDGFFRKPVDSSALLAAIGKALEASPRNK